jgi:uncharacterized membrane protein
MNRFPVWSRATAAKALMAALSLYVVVYAIVAYATLPLGSLLNPQMQATYVAHSIGIYGHIVGAAVALLLGPFQFSTRLRGARPNVHRWTGRVYLGFGVLCGGVFGLYMAQFAYGGAIARAGFATLALCWLYSGARAYLAIRRGAIQKHRKWMVRNFALTFAAVTLRIYLPLSYVTGIDFDIAYPAIAWLAWVPNLLVAEWAFNTAKGNVLRRVRPATSAHSSDS